MERDKETSKAPMVYDESTNSDLDKLVMKRTKVSLVTKQRSEILISGSTRKLINRQQSLHVVKRRKEFAFCSKPQC